MKTLLLFALVVTFLLSSCMKKDLPQEIIYASFLDCHNSQVWDSTKIANSIVGTWQLYALSCVWSSPNIDTIAISIELDSLGNFIVWDHGAMHSQGTWVVANKNPEDSTDLELDMNPYEGFISGAIFACTDQLLFYESGSDLCDKAYNRIK